MALSGHKSPVWDMQIWTGRELSQGALPGPGKGTRPAGVDQIPEFCEVGGDRLREPLMRKPWFWGEVRQGIGETAQGVSSFLGLKREMEEKGARWRVNLILR